MAERGLPVFPCRADKKPCTPHGFKDASADPRIIHALWRDYAGPLIGMPTGPASGMDLLDIDPRHGGLDWLDGMALYIGDTYTVLTRSGGTHYFYKHKQGVRNSEGVIAPGVDVRGDGGYAILWAGCGGSVFRDIPVDDWPEWLSEAAFLATKANQPKPASIEFPTTCRKPLRPMREGQRERIAMRMIGDQIVRVERAAGGQRHYALRAAAVTVGGLIDDLGISTADAAQQLYEAARRAGAEDLENASKTITSGLAFGQAKPLKIGEAR